MSNVGTIDRIIRAIVGVGLVIASVLFAGTIGLVLEIVGIVIGVVLLGTAAISFCPIYAALGLSSKPRNAR